jgi:signal transduction histidine kinase
MRLSTLRTHPTSQTMFALSAIILVLLMAALGLAVTALTLHPSFSDLRTEAICLLISGLLAIAITTIVTRLATAQGGLRVQLALPYLIATMVITLPLVIAVPLMFESREDVTYLLVLLAFGIAVSLILASAVALSLLSVVQALDGEAQRIAQGDYTTRLPEAFTRRGDELGRLSRSFNAMVECVHHAFVNQREADEARRQLIASISHDLRTPLSSLRAVVEAMADGVVADPATIHRYIHTMRSEARHLSALIDDLFEFSRLEAGGVTLTRDLTGLDDLLSDTLEAMQVAASSQGVELRGELRGTLPPAWIDARLIQRVLYNLVENAIRYTPGGGQVILSAGLTLAEAADGGSAKELLVEVRDSGEGIPSADLPHIFEPFYRRERSRTRHIMHEQLSAPSRGARRSRARDEGSEQEYQEGARAGLGLAIARHIITMHGGRLWAISPAPGGRGSFPGTSVFFTLPLPHGDCMGSQAGACS